MSQHGRNESHSERADGRGQFDGERDDGRSTVEVEHDGGSEKAVKNEMTDATAVTDATTSVHFELKGSDKTCESDVTDTVKSTQDELTDV